MDLDFGASLAVAAKSNLCRYPFGEFFTVRDDTDTPSGLSVDFRKSSQCAHHHLKALRVKSTETLVDKEDVCSGLVGSSRRVPGKEQVIS